MITTRGLAYQILLQLDRAPAHPDRLLRVVFERHTGLEQRDRALLTELVYGVIRWQRRLDWHVDQLSRIAPDKIQPEIRILLRLGLYQILFLDRVPNHAAVNETIKVAKQGQPKHLIGFVNGILRGAIRRHPAWNWPDIDEHPVERLAVMHSHPDWFAARLLREMDRDQAEDLCAANNRIAPMNLRVNTLKTSPGDLLEALRELELDATASPLLAEAVRVQAPRRDITKTEVFERGWFQIQDEAAQFISIVLAPQPGERVLDLCAGFGGKTTHCGILMKDRGEIVAIDEAAWKLQELENSTARHGISIVRTVCSDILAIGANQLGTFDRVLVDAPCSGFGVLRRNPDIKWRRTIKDPYRFSQTQRQLLAQAATLVKPGGTLVYATCTVFEEENQAVAADFQKAANWQPFPLDQLMPESCRDMTDGRYFRSWPHRHDLDGFFAARWTRPAS